MDTFRIPSSSKNIEIALSGTETQFYFPTNDYLQSQKIELITAYIPSNTASSPQLGKQIITPAQADNLFVTIVDRALSILERYPLSSFAKDITGLFRLIQPFNFDPTSCYLQCAAADTSLANKVVLLTFHFQDNNIKPR